MYFFYTEEKKRTFYFKTFKNENSADRYLQNSWIIQVKTNNF